MFRLVFALRKIAFAALAAFADRRVPVRLKLLAAAAALLVMSPQYDRRLRTYRGVVVRPLAPALARLIWCGLFTVRMRRKG